MDNLSVGSNVAGEGVNPRPSSPSNNKDQSKLRTILIVGIAAALLVGLIYLEVKYRLPSTAIAVLLSNPFVITGLVYIGCAAMLILTLRPYYIKRSEAKSSEMQDEWNRILISPRAETDRNGNYVPASVEVYQRSLAHREEMVRLQSVALENETLITYFNRQFPQASQSAYDLTCARVILMERIEALIRQATAEGTPYNRERFQAGLEVGRARVDVDYLERRASLALRFLMTNRS